MNLRPVNGGSKKFIGTVISLAFTLLVVWIFVMATMNDNTSRSTLSSADQVRLDSLRTALGRSAQKTADADAPNLFWNAFPAFLALGGGLFALWYWNRRRTQPTGGGELFEVVAEQQMGPNQSIKVLEFNGEYWVVGITANGMNLLSKIRKEDWSPPGSGEAPPLATSFGRLFSSMQKS